MSPRKGKKSYRSASEAEQSKARRRIGGDDAPRGRGLPALPYSTAYRLAQLEVMPSSKLGGHWRVLKSEIDRWIATGGGRN